MLSQRATTLTQQSRLAISLSWVGGYTNAFTLIVAGYTISHVTGNSTWIGVQIGQTLGPRLQFPMPYLYLVGMFLLGAMVASATTIGADRRGIASRYSLPIAIEAGLLLIFGCYVQATGNPDAPRAAPGIGALGLAAMAMGLQNGTITKISGAVVRTTHLTGVVTDFGLDSVHLAAWFFSKMRVRRPNRLRRVLRIMHREECARDVLLLSSIFGSFVMGCAVCALILRWAWPLHRGVGWPLALPVGFLLWMVYLDVRKPISDRPRGVGLAAKRSPDR